MVSVSDVSAPAVDAPSGEQSDDDDYVYDVFYKPTGSSRDQAISMGGNVATLYVRLSPPGRSVYRVTRRTGLPPELSGLDHSDSDSDSDSEPSTPTAARVVFPGASTHVGYISCPALSERASDYATFYEEQRYEISHGRMNTTRLRKPRAVSTRPYIYLYGTEERDLLEYHKC